MNVATAATAHHTRHASRPTPHHDAAGTVLAATYNVHSCIGRDGACAPERVLAVLREIDADIVGLQEVGRSRRRAAETLDQFTFFEHETGFHAVAGPNLHRHGAPYGNALLSRWPIVAVRRIDLGVRFAEPRGAIDADIDVGVTLLRVVVTHLGLRADERWRQIRRIQAALHEAETPVLVMGDFNLWGPEAALLRRLGAPAGREAAPPSFPTRWPVLPLDRLWTVPHGLTTAHRVHHSATAAVASDHLPVMAALQLHG